MEEVSCLESLEFNTGRKAGERGRGTEGSGLLTFNDCLWTISTNKQPLCICVLSVSSLATD